MVISWVSLRASTTDRLRMIASNVVVMSASTSKLPIYRLGLDLFIFRAGIDKISFNYEQNWLDINTI